MMQDYRTTNAYEAATFIPEVADVGWVRENIIHFLKALILIHYNLEHFNI